MDARIIQSTRNSPDSPKSHKSLLQKRLPTGIRTFGQIRDILESEYGIHLTRQRVTQIHDEALNKVLVAILSDPELAALVRDYREDQ